MLTVIFTVLGIVGGIGMTCWGLLNFIFWCAGRLFGSFEKRDDL